MNENILKQFSGNVLTTLYAQYLIICVLLFIYAKIKVNCLSFLSCRFLVWHLAFDCFPVTCCVTPQTFSALPNRCSLTASTIVATHRISTSESSATCRLSPTSRPATVHPDTRCPNIHRPAIVAALSSIALTIWAATVQRPTRPMRTPTAAVDSWMASEITIRNQRFQRHR